MNEENTTKFQEIELPKKDKLYLDLKQVVCIKEIEFDVTEVYLKNGSVISLDLSYNDLKELITPVKITGKLNAPNPNRK